MQNANNDVVLTHHAHCRGYPAAYHANVRRDTCWERVKVQLRARLRKMQRVSAGVRMNRGAQLAAYRAVNIRRYKFLTALYRRG